MSAFHLGAVFLTLLASVVGIGSFLGGIFRIYNRITSGLNAAPNRWDRQLRRAWTTVVKVIGHGGFRLRPAVRVSHWVVMVSFPLLFFTLVEGYGQVLDPSWSLPIFGGNQLWGLISELVAWLGWLGISFLALLRFGRGSLGLGIGAKGRGSPEISPSFPERANRFAGSRMSQGYFVELVIWTVCAAVIVIHALVPAGAYLWPTTWLAAGLGELDPGAKQLGVVAVSTLKVVISMLWMTVVGVVADMGVAWHRFLAFFTIFLGADPRGGKSLGALPPLYLGNAPSRVFDPQVLADPALLVDAPILGALTPRDLTWKQLLDVQACTECGRCQEVCPAWTTGKPLSPKNLVMSIRAAQMDQQLIGKNVGILGGQDTSRASLTSPGFSAKTGELGAVIDAQALWDCTSCGACVDACPLDIEVISLISALRRGQVLTAGSMPKPQAQVLRKISSRGNPWGIAGSKRLDWAADLPFEVTQIGQDVVDASTVDYLFWVGSAGSFDPDSRRTTAAVAELLWRAGVSFAVLGKAEPPTGDLARHLGDEALFLTQAQGVVELLAATKPKRILVTSPHVLNVLVNDVRQLGARYHVEHHTQVLARLIRDKRLKLAAPTPSPGKPRPIITYQDPCFLGRHNGEFTAPRQILGQIGQLVEMPQSGRGAMCCGAGSGHVFVENSTGERINEVRGRAAQETGAHFVATACPLCHLMLESGVQTGKDGKKPLVRDVAQLMLEAVRRAQPQPESHPSK